MPDVFKVLELIVAHVAANYPDEVDLVAYYGSHAQGTATAQSDLDLFYVPAEGRNPPVGRTVLIGGLLFDFWPIRWETLEGFATGRTRSWAMAPALVFHAKVAYRRSAEAEARLAALKRKIVDLQKPEARPEMVRRSLDKFPTVLAQLGNLRLAAAGGQFADVRSAAYGVLLAAWECLALANQRFCDHGFRSIIGQAASLQAKPAGFEELAQTIGTATTPDAIVAAADRIALGTREVLRQCQQSLPPRQSAQDLFEGAYPELKDGCRKVLSACERQRPFDAGIAAWHAQLELSQMLADLRGGIGSHVGFNLYSEFSAGYAELDLPNLMACAPNDFAHLAAETNRLDRRLRRWLGEHAISLAEFPDVDEFARSL